MIRQERLARQSFPLCCALLLTLPFGDGERKIQIDAHTPGLRSHLLLTDIEAARHFMTPGDIGHGPVGVLDMARRALRIEQRACIAIADQPVLERREASRIAGKAQRQRFVFAERTRDQRIEPDRLEQACRDAAGKGFADAGQDRQSGP